MATFSSEPALLPSTDVHARLDAYSEQPHLVQAEMGQQVREGQGSVSTLMHSVVQAQTHAIITELQAVEARSETLVRQGEERSVALPSGSR